MPAAKIFEKEDHFMILIAAWTAAMARFLELGDTLRQLRAGVAAHPGRFEKTGAEEFGDELKLVGGKSQQEAAGLKLYGILNT